MIRVPLAVVQEDIGEDDLALTIKVIYLYSAFSRNGSA